jgi:hypothetical protein
MGLRGMATPPDPWPDVELANPDGPPLLHVRETCVRSGKDTPKSKASKRTLALSSFIAEELCQHLARTPYKGPG